jgi:isoquinoline 1-oxidoreductase beta subunit
VEDNAVAVVAERWWQAKTALDALPITWNEGENAQASSVAMAAIIKAGLGADDAFVGNKTGDAASAIAGAKRIVVAEYGYPHQNHATMEPMNATAKWTEDRCEVWCPTQNGEGALAAAAEAAGLPPQQCEVYKMHLGGGFGRRGAGDYIRQAVLIAQQFPGTPVKLLWTREEDMLHGFFHPVTQAKLTAGLDADGNVAGFRARISGQSIIAGLMPERLAGGGDPVTFQCYAPSGEHALAYDFADVLVDHAMRNPPVRPGFWRGVNANQNTFYTESFIDELAHAAGRDPLEFRLAHMTKHPKNAAVLKAAAERAGWGTPAAPGVFRGLAQCTAFASHIAACAEVSVTNGQLKIHRIVAATDCGHAVNPQQIEAQVEGSFVYGLSAALFGECTVKDGRMEQDNFHTYPVMRMADMPKVETIVMPSGGFWGGVGEPTIAVAAPAVMNALFAATGKRIRSLPLKHHNLSA